MGQSRKLLWAPVHRGFESLPPRLIVTPDFESSGVFLVYRLVANKPIPSGVDNCPTGVIGRWDMKLVHMLRPGFGFIFLINFVLQACSISSKAIYVPAITSTPKSSLTPTIVVEPSSTPVPPTITPIPAQIGERSFTDRPDDHPDRYQFHVIYALFKDQDDRERDLDRSIARAIDRANVWF
jgi:hypothetical protein